jgi:hypothetical protein
MAGVLHLPVPLRRLPLRDHHRASQRDRHAHDNEEEGPGRETGNLSVSESQASTCAARFKPHPWILFRSLNSRLLMSMRLAVRRLNSRKMFEIRTWERFQFSIDTQHEKVATAPV